jgi:hypothetical protein
MWTREDHRGLGIDPIVMAEYISRSISLCFEIVESRCEANHFRRARNTYTRLLQRQTSCLTGNMVGHPISSLPTIEVAGN